MAGCGPASLRLIIYILTEWLSAQSLSHIEEEQKRRIDHPSRFSRDVTRTTSSGPTTQGANFSQRANRRWYGRGEERETFQFARCWQHRRRRRFLPTVKRTPSFIPDYFSPLHLSIFDKSWRPNQFGSTWGSLLLLLPDTTITGPGRRLCDVENPHNNSTARRRRRWGEQFLHKPLTRFFSKWIKIFFSIVRKRTTFRPFVDIWTTTIAYSFLFISIGRRVSVCRPVDKRVRFLRRRPATLTPLYIVLK